MGLTLVLDLIIVALVLVRQRRIRPLSYGLRLGLPLFLFVVGIFQLRDFTDHHPVDARGVLALTLCFAVGAVALGWVRALTVHIWPAGPFLLRQATWGTMVLWAVSLGLLAGFAAVVPTSTAPAGLAGASLLVYLAVTYATQSMVLRRRAVAVRRAEEPIDVFSTTVQPDRPGPDPEPGTRPAPTRQAPSTPSAIEVRSWDVEPNDGPDGPARPGR